MTAMRVPVILDPRYARLLPAFGASLAIHVAVLLLTISALGAALAAPADGTRGALDVRIVDASPPAPAEVLAVPADAPSSIPVPVAGVEAVEHKETTVSAAPVTPVVPDRGRAVGPAPIGTVTVTPNDIYALLGEELDKRAHAEFPSEVDKPVQLTSSASVEYPKPALAQRIEESIVAWIVVSAEGEVEEVQIENDASEFKDAVVAAARQSRYSPAENKGERIRHYIMLEYRFRIDAPPSAIATTPPS
jgi:TonB family protein